MDMYLQTVKDIDKGRLCEDLAEKFADLIGKVKERGKSGSITLSLKIKPLDEDAESVSVVAGVKVAEPAKPERASIFFTTDENSLVRDNPKQAEMKLEPVEKTRTEILPVAKSA